MRVLDPFPNLLGRAVRDAHLGEQLAAERQVGDFVVRADIVDLAHLALVQDRVKGIRRVAGEKVAPGGATVAVQDHGLAAVQQTAELGDDLFGVLVGSVDVVAADNDDGQLEALLVRVDKHLGGGLGGGIRVGGREDAALEEVVVVVLDFAVDFVGGNVNEALDAYFFGALEEHVGAVDVCVGEAVRVAKAEVNVRLCGKVENGVNVVALQTADDFVGVGNVALVKRKVALVVEHARVVERRAVVELVERDNVVRVGIRQCQVADQPASTFWGVKN